MSEKTMISDLVDRMKTNLKDNILPFWSIHMFDEQNGGFWGRVDENLCPDRTASKAVVLNTRMLWTFSNACRVFGDEKYRLLADRAFEYIRDHFWDKQFGGVFWMLNYHGEPIEVEKRTYGQAFIIYSMAEYYRTFGNTEALEMAKQTFMLVNQYAQCDNGGYADSLTRDWRMDNWLWRWHMNPGGAVKLLNSHLHLFEATITLYKATKLPAAARTLRSFLLFLLNEALDKDLHHLKAGMDMNNKRTDNEISYGHDSECSYLLVQAARLLEDEQLIRRAEETAVDIMDHVLAEGIDPRNKGMYSERDSVSGHVDKCKVWWVQAEAVTAFFNCFQITGNDKFLHAAVGVWDYVEKYVSDAKNGEWLSLGANGYVDPDTEERERLLRFFMPNDKANRAKCPYHNARCCIEIMERAASLL